MTLTREQAVYKIQRVREIVGKINDGSMAKMNYVDKINLMQESREIQRDLIKYRKENPDV